jgi:hypothetical protein
VEATPARTYDEVAATKTMIKRTDKRMGLKPKYLAAVPLRAPDENRKNSGPPRGRRDEFCAINTGV